MYASQLIYTACGKDRTGAFGVWSKSSDITKAESDEITKLMFYKRPADLPYEPTDEELRTLFPKKYGYFQLSSGRFCLARSVYIGRVYSDLDQRSGNYIIHAFVFSELGDLQPMRFFGSDCFRSGLSYNEWHEQDAPEALPPAELKNPPMEAILADVTGFFRLQSSTHFPCLLQAVLNACESGDNVTFHDTDDALALWYRAFCLCVPASMQQKLTYCSFHTPTATVSTQSTAAATDVKLRNVQPTVPASVYSYQEAVRSGKYAFELCGGVMNTDVPLSRYVRTVTKLLKTSPAKALKMADTVDALMTTHGCSLGEATDLCSLLNLDLEWVSDLQELLNVIELAKRIAPQALSTIADSLYNLCVANSGWPYDNALLQIYRFVFDYSENANKGFIINQYLRHLPQFGIDTTAPCDAFVRQVKDKAPFLWINFVDFMFDSETTFFRDYLLENDHSFNSRYLVYTSMIDEVQNLDKNQKNTVYQFCQEMILRAIKAESIAEFNALLPHLRRFGPNADIRFITKALQTLMQTGQTVTDICSIDFLLNLAHTVSSPDLGCTVLDLLISENQDDPILIAKFAALSASNSAFAACEKRLRDSGRYARFFENVDIMGFAQLPNPSPNDLDRYYRRIFLADRDTGLFIRKLTERMTTLRDAALIAECLSAYHTYFEPLSDHHSQISPCVQTLGELIARAGMDAMMAFAKKRGMNTFTPLIARLRRLGCPMPPEYTVLEIGTNTRVAVQRCDRGNGLAQQEVLRALDDRSLFAPLDSRRAINLYLSHYGEDLVHLYLVLAKRDFAPVFERCIGPFTIAEQLTPTLIAVMDRLDKRDYSAFVTDLFSYANGHTTSEAEACRHLLHSYLDGLSRGRQNKVFSTVLGLVLPEYRKSVKTFIDNYQDEHPTWTQKLFGKKTQPARHSDWDAPQEPPANPKRSKKD